MNNIRIEYAQLPFCPQHFQQFARKTEDDFSKKWLWAYASLMLRNWLNIGKNPKVQLLSFNLNIPIFVDVYWNEDLVLELAQTRFSKKRKYVYPDFKYRVNKRLYILVPLNSLDPSDKSNIPIPPSNFNYNKIFNTIEYQQMGPVKYATPILYTGMTN